MADPALSVPDSEHARALGWLPPRLRAYASLARFDRPIGAWLLFWPGAWAVALAGAAVTQWRLLALLAVGSVAMRGAGCVYNDIVDRDLDRRVARTAARPLASGAIGLRGAWAFLLSLCLVGLAVLVALDWPARWVAVASLAPVAAYPFMKRITWWPQAWLGLVFSWGVPVGWAAATGGLATPAAWLYAGSLLWVVGYDTIYALQDVEDDAIAGVKSSARALGSHARRGVALCYLGALAGWAAAIWSVRPQALALVALLPAALHLGWQVATLRREESANALARFRANRTTGLLVFLAMLVVGEA